MSGPRIRGEQRRSSPHLWTQMPISVAMRRRTRSRRRAASCGFLRAIIRGIDYLLRRSQRVFEFSARPDCLLRVAFVARTLQRVLTMERSSSLVHRSSICIFGMNMFLASQLGGRISPGRIYSAEG
jgi:hypothetical protein